ncbi:MAG: LysR substrate-binding domain-containing protein [Pseudomonadota bacterium]
MSANLHFNLRMLSYLVALDEHRHFGRAADACFVTQPTLSTQIKKLEEQLGVTLVERHNKGIQLTQTGEAIAARARDLLREARSISDLAEAHQDPQAGRLRVGLIPTLAPYLLPHAAPCLSEHFQRLKCLYLEVQTDPLMQSIRQGDIDLGILALPLDLNGCESQNLFDEPFRLAVDPSHPLADRDFATHDDLAGEHFLLLEDGHCLRDQALEVCTMAGNVNEDEFRATSLETLRQMVAGGAGVTLLPELAIIDRDTRQTRLVTLPFKSPAPVRTVVGVWRASHPRDALIRSVCETISGCIPHLSQHSGDG